MLRSSLCGAGLALLLAAASAVSAAAAGCPNESLRSQQGSTFLPDCRAAEVVSPRLKNGADISGMPTRTRVASDGSAVQFASLGGFLDVRGGNVTSEYMAIRTGVAGTSGWVTHSVTPGNLVPGSLIEAVVSDTESHYMGEFSPDLNRGMFLANSDFTQTSNSVRDLPNLALRTNLRVPGAGNFVLASDCNGCGTALPSPNPDGKPFLAGASQDFGHVIFESQEPLTAEASSCTPVFFQVSCAVHLYEWSGGSVRLAGWEPPPGDTECGAAPLDACVAADNSQAGQSAAQTSYTPHTISADGSRIIFTVNTGGQRLAGRLYMRIDNGDADARTVQLNASERINPDAVPADAIYWAASADDSKVFFTTKENLSNSDNTPENNADLYEYDIVADAQGHHLRQLSVDQVGGGADVHGVVGATDDGRTVYFLSATQLLPGQPTTTDGERIYRWHDGTLQDVGKADFSTRFPLAGNPSIGGWVGGWTARISADGDQLLFSSPGTDELPHTGIGDRCGNTSDRPCIELFLFDATANGGQGSIVCASCAQPDAPGTGDASFSTNVDKGAAALTSHLNHPLSADGRYVFFDTTAALVPGDHDGLARDVYEFDNLTGDLHLLSNAKSQSFGANFLDANPSGSDVFVATRDKLTPWDTDDNADIYDIRVNGGVARPAAPRADCDATTCRGSHTSSPPPAPPSSSTIRATGNLKHRRHVARCARAKVRRRVHGKVRCVRRAGHHRRGHRASAVNSPKGR